MKRSALSAILVVSLVLSQEAHCANAEPTKAPLTAAEKAQCKVQLTEYNQGVQAYNAELDKLKGLEAEIDALHAALEKEQAAVNRRDNAAMDALNARIGKNNELVEQHEQMSASIKTMASERKQLADQFHEQCENRPIALSPPPPPPPSAQAQRADSACGSTTGAKDVKRQIEATFDEMRADEKRRQAEVDRVAKERAKAQSWSEERRGKVWMQILGSPKFMAFEREKQPMVQELMRIIGSKPKNVQEECQQIQRIAAMLPAIKAVNARQYAFMADEIRAAK